MAQITSAEQALKDLVETYLKETPKIDSSLKTLLSISIAKNQTTNEQTNTPLSANVCLELIRSISLSINKIELLEPLAWSSKFPQKENTTGMQRMDEIAEYKALYTLHRTLKMNSKNNNNIKITKAFGVSFLKTKGILHQVIENANILLSESLKRKGNLKLKKEDVDNFYKNFSKSVYLAPNMKEKKNVEVINDDENKTNDANDDDVDTNSLLDIVWLSNWKAEIEKRRELRHKKVNERMKRDEEIAKDLVKEHLEAIKEMPSQVKNTEELMDNNNNETTTNKKPDVLQVSSVIRDKLINEGFSKINVLNALIDANGDIDKARDILVKNRGKKTP